MIRCCTRALLLFAALAGSAAAARPPPPRTATPANGVSPALADWLGRQYGPTARWNRPWRQDRQTADATAMGARGRIVRRVCRDVTTAMGDRWVAICGDVQPFDHGTSGRIDVFLLRSDPAGAVAVRGERRDIPSGSFGKAGAVDVLPLGDRGPGLLLRSAYTGTGTRSEDVTLLLPAADDIDRVVQFTSRNDTAHGCGNAPCRANATQVTCTLRTGPADADGWPALRIEARGRDGAERIRQDIPLHRDGPHYRVDRAVLDASPCAYTE